jgi:hypothetical protein
MRAVVREEFQAKCSNKANLVDVCEKDSKGM